MTVFDEIKAVLEKHKDHIPVIATAELLAVIDGAEAKWNDGWIPTAEMLFPRYRQKVLASVRTDIATHEVIITEYQRQEYWHNGIITAWMPLPPVYQK